MFEFFKEESGVKFGRSCVVTRDVDFQLISDDIFLLMRYLDILLYEIYIYLHICCHIRVSSISHSRYVLAYEVFCSMRYIFACVISLF